MPTSMPPAPPHDTHDDLLFLAALPEAQRQAVRVWQACLSALTGPVDRGLAQVGRRLGVGKRTAWRKYMAWRRDGLRGLADGRALVARTGGTSGVPPALVAQWQELLAANQRKSKPAHRELLRLHALGRTCLDPAEPLPGYATLMRRVPRPVVLAALRQGRTAAAALGPQVRTTRVGLWPGSHYLVDDIEHDHMVNILDTRQTGRPLELHALDLWSAYKFAWGMKVRTEDEATGIMRGLLGEEMRMLVAVMMGGTGYHPERGTTFTAEHGTAAIPEWLEKLLFDLSQGMVRVERSGMQGDPAFTGQYAGRGKGNFRFKAALESLGNLIHNEFAALPGQTGLSVARRPDELHGLLKHNDALLDACAEIAVTRPELAQQLQFELVSFAAFREFAAEVYARINARTDHRLEGWDARTMPAQAPDGQMILRRMSPTEVWRPGRRELRRFSPAAVAMILWRDSAQERVVTDRREIEVQDRTLAADALRYDARALPAGEKVATLVNPFAPEVLWCYGAKGQFRAALPRLHAPCRADAEGVQAEFARARGALAEPLMEAAHLHRARTRERIERMKANGEVLRAAGFAARPRTGAARVAAPDAAALRYGRAALEADTTAPAPAPAPDADETIEHFHPDPEATHDAEPVEVI